jgi:hypothetical protein
MERLEALSAIPHLCLTFDVKEANRARNSSLLEKHGEQIGQFFLLHLP